MANHPEPNAKTEQRFFYDGSGRPLKLGRTVCDPNEAIKAPIAVQTLSDDSEQSTQPTDVASASTTDTLRVNRAPNEVGPSVADLVGIVHEQTARLGTTLKSYCQTPVARHVCHTIGSISSTVRNWRSDASLIEPDVEMVTERNADRRVM